jgi:hypothetical protein
MPENFVVQPLWRAPGRAITSRGEDRLSALVAVLSGMFPIRMFRAAESGTLHPERRAPIGRTRMIRGVAPASLSPEVNAIRRVLPHTAMYCALLQVSYADGVRLSRGRAHGRAIRFRSLRI